MKRFHVHLSVQDLDSNIRFYTTLFGQAPSRREDDYAKWMLDDPRINFAISTRGASSGLDHFGFQMDDGDELARLRERARNADAAILDEGTTQCCYANSEKHWLMDPQGVPWEHFVTMGEIRHFGSPPVLAETVDKPTGTSGSGAEKTCCG
ncbi:MULTISPECIES: ArsI/CadI family heavy metal resistance metalloenzyme [Marinobacter]|jgi:catechol 2,3-dioxygenase-like lactoylglutathione lyase family enzyme|uniref:Glyoxalase-like domain-containing protein n=1 Tax=Marinobacter segnicrescens TaxID=430453 RepID=A0A1I0GMZ6_9GAMM|nr:MULTISPECIES: ArsI/CadI family heavy metal resistance metalloenzyme [Marinobacter]UZD65608.1 VOC family protein [Marinobacter sp. AN1]SET72395.1 Glyoxalase-like domain-containing protein [Marinobacter segnicrescens]|tara:strand:- start:22 stop:474 length:453 start_codon:yes stop_codon:yes gene_type:complete